MDSLKGKRDRRRKNTVEGSLEKEKGEKVYKMRGREREDGEKA